jgi:hypothetical protein
METPRSSLSDTGKRHYEYDWLTVLAMLTIFSYHCARFFNFEDWHVKNAQLSGGMSLYVAVVEQWIMPLFFVLSGISSYYSLADRKGGGYIGNRVPAAGHTAGIRHFRYTGAGPGLDRTGQPRAVRGRVSFVLSPLF